MSSPLGSVRVRFRFLIAAEAAQSKIRHSNSHAADIVVRNYCKEQCQDDAPTQRTNVIAIPEVSELVTQNERQFILGLNLVE